MKNIKNYINILLPGYVLALQAQSVSYNQEFQVNTYTSNDQVKPRVSRLIDGGFVICWESGEQDGSMTGIYCQIYNSDVSRRGTEFRVNTKTEWNQQRPCVTGLLDGGFVVTWLSQDYSQSEFEIHCQLFNSDGSLRGTEIQVTSTNSVRFPSITSLIDSGFVICWQGARQNGQYFEVVGQLFNNDGSKRGAEFHLNEYTRQEYPIVSSLVEGGFVVCWEGSGQDLNEWGIFGQIFDSTGERIGSEFQVNTYTNSSYEDRPVRPSVSYLKDGGFVVCWHFTGRDVDGNSHGIFGQIFKSDGSKYGTEFLVNTHTKLKQDAPSITGLLDGGFVICWHGVGRNGDESFIYGQLYNSNGSPEGIEMQVNFSHYADNPNVTNFDIGKFVICWQVYNQDGANIYGKYHLNELIHPVKTFSLEYPAHDSIVKEISVNFRWQKASNLYINLPWELKYSLYLADNENFTNPQTIPAIYDTIYSVDYLIPGTTYFWKVLAKNIAGDSVWSTEVNGFLLSHDATIVESISDNQSQILQLFANYPNPFNPETTITYSLPSTQSVHHVKIKIYDSLGRLILILKDKLQDPGIHKIKWNGKNSFGQSMPSGIYYIELQAGLLNASQKIMLVR